MATQVMKRDGSKQPFDELKMKRSIEASCNDAGLPAEETERVVGEVFSTAQSAVAVQDEIASSEIKEIILNELDRVEPKASAAWRAHDEEKAA